MTNPPPPAVFAKDYEGVPLAQGGSITGGIWSIDGDRLVCIEPVTAGPAVVLVPSELVLMLPVPLPPLTSTARRREALPFAIEDRIAEPLEHVHVAIGTELATGVWLAGVVSDGVMRQWVAQADAAGLDRASLVPDALTLPLPEQACWSVHLANGRAMVRAGDGSAFALPMALFEAGWRAAGEPVCIAYGEALPLQFSAMPMPQDLAPLADRCRAPALDLRQGAYAPARRPLHPLWRRIALIAGIGALAHGVIAIADTTALAHLAATRDTQVRAEAAALQPPVPVGADLADTLNALSPDAAAAGPSQFMTLLSRSAAALDTGKGGDKSAGGPQSATVWRSVAFDRAAGTLTIEVEVADLAQLQLMAQALTRAGLTAQPGAASSEAGHAVGSFVIRAS